MNARRLIPVRSAGPAAGAAGVVPTGARALAAPPSGGCPAGYRLLPVPTLTGSPTSGVADAGPGAGQGWAGQPGKGDGLVCGVQLGDQLTPFGLPACNFTGKKVPA